MKQGVKSVNRVAYNNQNRINNIFARIWCEEVQRKQKVNIFWKNASITCIQTKWNLQREFMKDFQVNNNKIYQEIMENLKSVNIC